MRGEVGLHQARFGSPKRHAAISVADGDVAPSGEVCGGDLLAGRLKIMNKAACV